MSPPPDTAWLDANGTGEGWVRRAEQRSEQHACEPPMKDAVYTLPATPPPPAGRQAAPTATRTTWTERIVDGQHGDLWRCRCGELWRVGVDCDRCDQLPRDRWGACRSGWHAWKFRWRHATWWQRVRNRRINP